MQAASHLVKKCLGRDDASILKCVRVFLFDCDGVIWKGAEPIPGSIETLNYLKKIGKSVYYLTNNSTKSRSETLQKLQNMGVQSTLDEVITSSYATAQYLKREGERGPVYVVGERGIYEELEAVGIPCCGLEDNGRSDISVLAAMDSRVRTVVVGLDRCINYVKLSRAASYVRDFGCRFVATNTDGSFPNAGGILSGGSGCMVAAIAAASGRQPDCVIGKPSSFFIDLVRAQRPDVGLNEIMMVGDRLDTDIAFAHANHIQSLCVLSGISSETAVLGADASCAPSFYSSSLQDVKTVLESSV